MSAMEKRTSTLKFRCLLYPRKQTSGGWAAMSAKCQKQTFSILGAMPQPPADFGLIARDLLTARRASVERKHLNSTITSAHWDNTNGDSIRAA